MNTTTTTQHAMKTEITTPLKRGRPPLPTGEGATSHLHMRVTRAQKASYVRAAVAEKKKLSEWVTARLDRAAQP